MKPSVSDFPVTRKWPPRHPDRLQLYSQPTPNGVVQRVLNVFVARPAVVRGLTAPTPT